MLTLYVIVCIISGYLLGAIPSSYLIGRFAGKIDLLKEGPNHVSAAAIYRQLGLGPFVPVVVIDACKGMPAMFMAQVLTGSVWVVAATAVAATIGHCWSAYIKFYGGMGGVIILGNLLYLGIYYGANHVPFEFIAGGLVASAVMMTVKKSTLSTFLWLMIASIAYFAEIIILKNGELALALLPLALWVIQFSKMLQSGGAMNNKNLMVPGLNKVRNTGHE